MNLSKMDEDLRRMVLEGKEFNIFNINIEALKQEGFIMINYPVDGYTEKWIALMERLRDIIKMQGSNVPEEEWLPFNLCARKKGCNVFIAEFNFFFSLLDEGSCLFKIGSKYSPMALKKPSIIEMIGMSKAFMYTEISSRC